jgi:hypothetical protein
MCLGVFLPSLWVCERGAPSPFGDGIFLSAEGEVGQFSLSISDLLATVLYTYRCCKIGHEVVVIILHKVGDDVLAVKLLLSCTKTRNLSIALNLDESILHEN